MPSTLSLSDLFAAAHLHPSTVLLADGVVLHPTSTNLPGGNVLQQLADGIGGWALTLSLIGLVAGAAAWALGSHTQNFQHTFVGRKAVLISGLAALLIGAAPVVINSFFNLGTGAQGSTASGSGGSGATSAAVSGTSGSGGSGGSATSGTSGSGASGGGETTATHR